MSVRIRINSNEFLKEAKQTVDGLTKERFRECGPAIGETFVQICTKFVPWDTGTLAGSGGTTMEGDSIRVHWSEEKDGHDIAHMMYYDEPREWSHDGERTSYWAETAMAKEGETFKVRCQKILNGR